MTVTIKANRRRRDGQTVLTPNIIFLIINTHHEVLEWCRNTIGVGWIVEAKSTKKTPRRLRCFRYRLDTNQDLVSLLPQLLPYLKVKRQQTERALDFLKARALRTSTRVAFTESEVGLLFDLRWTNRKLYDQNAVQHLRYLGVDYTREAFLTLFMANRDGSLYRVVEWSPDMDGLLGTDFDGRIAKKLGLKLHQVQSRRSKLGIPPKVPSQRLTPE